MEYKRIFKDGIHLLAGKMGVVALGIANLMILSRILTTEEMGKYSLFLMIVNLAIVIGLDWSNSSVIRHGREELVKRKKINQSFWARMYIFIPVIIFFTTLFIIFSKQITTYIGVSRWVITLVISLFIFNGILDVICSIYQSTDRMKKSAYVFFSQKLFCVIFTLLLVFDVGKPKLTLVLILINLSFLLSIIINLLRFDYKKILPYMFNKKYLKRIWSYSWPQLMGFPGLYLVNYIDLFVIKKYSTLSDVGIYNIAYNGFINVATAIVIIQTIFLPLIVEYRAKKKHDLIRSYAKKIPLFATGWMAMAIVGMLLSPIVIPLIFSTKYVASIPSFNILLIASIFYLVSICLLPLINAFDFIIYSQAINLITAGINIIMDFILVPRMGIVGAAYGTTIAYFIRMILSIILVIIKKKKMFLELS